MSQELRRRMFAVAWGTGSVKLQPEPGSETLPPNLNITRVVLTTSATTPDTQFFEASGSGCGRFEVIIRKLM